MLSFSMLVTIILTLATSIDVNAQYYYGTSTSSVDYIGNVNTTYRDNSGTTIYSTSSTDFLGNTNTTYRNSYGATIGSTTSSTDFLVNVNTTNRDSYGSTTG